MVFLTATGCFCGDSLTRFKFLLSIFALAGLTLLSSCNTCGLSSSGPTNDEVHNFSTCRLNGIQLVDIDFCVAQRLLQYRDRNLFSEVFQESPPFEHVIGAGDTVGVSIWEAPPGFLFSTPNEPSLGGSSSKMTTLPGQMVRANGTIGVPFVGQVSVLGKTPAKVEEEIVAQLKDKAHDPHVLVNVTENNTTSVTVLGEVKTNQSMPLTPKRERVLDALAVAGGASQPVSQTSLQLTRGPQVHQLPLDTVIRDPKQNIILEPGDIVAAIHQPSSFTVLGAMCLNAEIFFEAPGVSLAQALARAGGLRDERADARAVFIFRFENPEVLDCCGELITTPDGKVPVIYQLDLKDPASFFVAQRFPLNDKDILYVSNSPAAEFTKFVGVVSGPLASAACVGAFVR